jgi:hypothetical protein
MYKALSFFAVVLFSMSCNNVPQAVEKKAKVNSQPQITVSTNSLVKNVHTTPIDDSAKISDADLSKMDKYFGK